MIYRQSAHPKPSWWQQLLCRLQLHHLEVVWIEERYECDVWHHECPWCAATSKVYDL